jgi:Ca-activated chloride channel family protein
MILLLSLTWLIASNGVVRADGMLLPLPESLDTANPAVRYHHVTVSIEDGHAVTRVEQEFYNPHNVPVTGRYLFPVPPEAILSHFEAEVDGRRQEAIRQDAATTNAELYSLVTQQRDPSLLQYADWESLAFDLDLSPGGARVMRLEYEQVLVPGGGLYRYRYVLSTERYSSLPLEEVSVAVDLNSSAGLASLYSSSHEVTIERQGPGQARVHWEAEGVNPATDFELFYSPAEKGYGSGLLTGERGGQDHFLLFFSPEGDLDEVESVPKDIVFVVDRSGSMNGTKIEQARNALHYMVGQLGYDDRFSIISFDDAVSVLDYGLQPVDDRSLQEARHYVDRLTADGNTDLESALQTALEMLLGSEDRGAARMVLFLTDGLPTAGITDEELIARRVADTNAAAGARLHVFGVGYDVNSHLLDSLAAGNGGTVTYVRPGEDLELALTTFYGKVAHPLLTDVEVELEGLESSEIYPEYLPDLFRGSSLLLTGRYRADGEWVTVRVRGWAGDVRREFVYRFSLTEAGEHDFVPRLWATRRVGALLDRVRVEGVSPELESEIRELGLSYGVVTPYTTFVIDGQVDGAASAENMHLYGMQEVNEATGRVTIEARMQNQMYQQAMQADLASGANVTHYGKGSLAEVGAKQVDLSLLRGKQAMTEPITDEWLERNAEPDRTIEFGSKEYFALAANAEARPFLQSGRNVIFEYQGEVIAIQDAEHDAPGPEQVAPFTGQTVEPGTDKSTPRNNVPSQRTVSDLVVRLVWLVPIAATAMMLVLAALTAVVGYALIASSK